MYSEPGGPSHPNSTTTTKTALVPITTTPTATYTPPVETLKPHAPGTVTSCTKYANSNDMDFVGDGGGRGEIHNLKLYFQIASAALRLVGPPRHGSEAGFILHRQSLG